VSAAPQTLQFSRLSPQEIRTTFFFIVDSPSIVDQKVKALLNNDTNAFKSS
jgi:hypothetical protein